MKRLALLLIRFYQLGISPFLGKNCRFNPTCSSYAKEAFEKKPFFTALGLTLKRISKCHPFHEGGDDPLL